MTVKVTRTLIGSAVLMTSALRIPTPIRTTTMISRTLSIRFKIKPLIFSLIVYQFGDALQITFANALRGTTDVKPMMWIAFFSYFIVALPVGYLCGFTWGGGVVGVWVAFPAGLFTAGFLFWLRFRYRLQQLMKK